MKKIVSVLITMICLVTGPGWAQQEPVLHRPAMSSFVEPVPSIKQQLDSIFKSVYPTEVQTFENVQETFYRTGQTDACQLVAVLNNTDHIRGLTAEQAEDLAVLFAYAQGCANQLPNALFYLLENTPFSDEKMLSFYTMAAASLGHNINYYKEVQEWAFARVKRAAHSPEAKEGIWPATLLLLLAADATYGDWPYIMNLARRQKFEGQLKETILSYDWIKNISTDYVMKDVRSNSLWSVSNQGALISLFLQANSFFAYKDDDGFAKAMISTGGFKELMRLGTFEDAEKAHTMRFANDGETFYFSHPTPGTDGKGNFVDSANGRRHYILSQLVYALCVSYATRHGEEASDLIKKFTRRYFLMNDGDFSHYLYVPLQSMRAGRELLENEFLEGWQAQEQSLQKELYALLKKNYRASWVCAGVQGACEVAMEWQAFNVFFKLVGKAVSAGAHVVQKTAFKALPVKTSFALIAFDISAKHTLVLTKNSIKNFLHAHGWKLAAAGAVGVGVTADKTVVRPVAR